MRSFLAFAVLIGAGFAIGVAVRVALTALNFPERTVSAASLSVWLLFAVTSFAYFTLWNLKPGDLRLPPDATDLQRARFMKAEGKRQTAVFRLAAVFGIMGGTAAQLAEADAMTTGFVVAGSVIVGTLVGLDWKKRYDRIRERLLADSTPNEKE